MTTPEQDHELAYFNGLWSDGRYLQSPLSLEELGRRVLGITPDWKPPEEDDPRGHDDPTRAPRTGVDGNCLDESGWAVVFPAGYDPQIRRALDDLLNLRRDQAGTFYNEEVLGPDEDVDSFLARLRAPLGLADPLRLPYYVLLVGGPEEISFEFQYQLDMAYAVGRIHFDTPAEYERYAKTVVDAEAHRYRRRRGAAFFAPQNGDDSASRRTRHDLVEPLASYVEEKTRWPVERYTGTEADRDRLIKLFSDDVAPALLFNGCHGLTLEIDDPRQFERQGALVTSDWNGQGSVKDHQCVAASDLDKQRGPAGLVVFNFACFGGGTPTHDNFDQTVGSIKPIAEVPFVSALSQHLLRKRDGALAVVSHVDRAWTTSFDWYRDTGQRAVFECVLEELLKGRTVGDSMERFGQLTGDLAVRLARKWELRHRGQPFDLAHFGRLWVAHNDARNFVVFGDPAVRLAV